jgi:hypothetical protein
MMLRQGGVFVFVRARAFAAKELLQRALGLPYGPVETVTAMSPPDSLQQFDQVGMSGGLLLV